MKTNSTVASVIGLALIGLSAAPAFAETSSSTPNTPSASAKITCVGTAVAAREQALGTALSALNTGITGAYTARSAALSQAYAKTDPKEVKSSVKAAWSTFSSAIKSTRKTWKMSRDQAWTTFRSAVKQCKAPEGISDGANAGSEVSGN